MKDIILEIIQKNYNKFKGTNEAELQSAEEIEELVNKAFQEGYELGYNEAAYDGDIK